MERTCVGKIHKMGMRRQNTNGKNSRQITKKKTFSKARPQKSLRYDPNPFGKGPEKKNIDTVQQEYDLPLTASFGSLVLLNGIAQGSSPNERLGRRVALKSLQLRATHYSSSLATQARIVIFYDRQPNGSTPSAADLIGTSQFEGVVTMGNSDRFVILMDEITDPVPFTNAHNSVKRYLKMDLEEIFGNTGSTISSINTGAIFLMMANNGSNSIGVETSATFTTRIRYIDA